VIAAALLVVCLVALLLVGGALFAAVCMGRYDVRWPEDLPKDEARQAGDTLPRSDE